MSTKTGFGQYGYTPSPTGTGTYSGSGTAADPYKLGDVTVSATRSSGSSALDSIMSGIKNFQVKSAADYINGGFSPIAPNTGSKLSDSKNLIIIVAVVLVAAAAFFLMRKK